MGCTRKCARACPSGDIIEEREYFMHRHLTNCPAIEFSLTADYLEDNAELESILKFEKVLVSLFW